MWALKDQVIKALADENGGYITMNELAERFDVSRTAIRNICLRAADKGLPIEFVQRKGFRLIPQDKVLNEAAIKVHLKTKELGCVLTIMDEAATMSRPLFQPMKHMRHGQTLLVRERVLLPYDGKSQEYTPYDGIYMSILLCRDSTPAQWKKEQESVLEAVQKTMQNDFGISLSIDKNRFVSNQKLVGWIQTYAVQSGVGVRASCICIYIYGDISRDYNAEDKVEITDLATLAGRRLPRAEVAAKLLNKIEEMLQG